MFKLQLQEDDNDPQAWHDVKGQDGKLLTFEKEIAARAKLKELYAVVVTMERHAIGSKWMRVTNVIKDMKTRRDRKNLLVTNHMYNLSFSNRVAQLGLKRNTAFGEVTWDNKKHLQLVS